MKHHCVYLHRCDSFLIAVSIPPSLLPPPLADNVQIPHSQAVFAVRWTICRGNVARFLLRKSNCTPRKVSSRSKPLRLLSSPATERRGEKCLCSRASHEESHASRRLHIPHPVSTLATTANPSFFHSCLRRSFEKPVSHSGYIALSGDIIATRNRSTKGLKTRESYASTRVRFRPLAEISITDQG